MILFCISLYSLFSFNTLVHDKKYQCYWEKGTVYRQFRVIQQNFNFFDSVPRLSQSPVTKSQNLPLPRASYHIQKTNICFQNTTMHAVERRAKAPSILFDHF